MLGPASSELTRLVTRASVKSTDQSNGAWDAVFVLIATYFYPRLIHLPVFTGLNPKLLIRIVVDCKYQWWWPLIFLGTLGQTANSSWHLPEPLDRLPTHHDICPHCRVHSILKIWQSLTDTPSISFHRWHQKRFSGLFSSGVLTAPHFVPKFQTWSSLLTLRLLVFCMRHLLLPRSRPSCWGL